MNLLEHLQDLTCHFQEAALEVLHVKVVKALSGHIPINPIFSFLVGWTQIQGFHFWGLN